MCTRVLFTVKVVTGVLNVCATEMVETWRVACIGGAAAVSEQPSALAVCGDGHPVFAARTNSGNTMDAAQHNSATGALIWSKTFVGGSLSKVQALASGSPGRVTFAGLNGSSVVGGGTTWNVTANVSRGSGEFRSRVIV